MVEVTLADAPWPGLYLGEWVVAMVVNIQCTREAETRAAVFSPSGRVWGYPLVPGLVLALLSWGLYRSVWLVAPVSWQPLPRWRCWLVW